jgi:hypothetical protein
VQKLLAWDTRTYRQTGDISLSSVLESTLSVVKLQINKSNSLQTLAPNIVVWWLTLLPDILDRLGTNLSQEIGSSEAFLGIFSLPCKYLDRTLK